VPAVLAPVCSNRPGGPAVTDRVLLARQLGWVAGHLDSKGYPFAAPVRVAARIVLEVPDHDDPDGCRGCGDTLTQPATGRRRIWCSEACRSRTRRR
jgi:hypothetical protein